MQCLAPSRDSVNPSFLSSLPLCQEGPPGNAHSTMEQGVTSQAEVNKPSVDFSSPKNVYECIPCDVSGGCRLGQCGVKGEKI